MMRAPFFKTMENSAEHPAETDILAAIKAVDSMGHGDDQTVLDIMADLANCRDRLHEFIDSLPIGTKVGSNLYISPDRTFQAGPGDA